MDTISLTDHWQKVYTTKARNEVSWYQPVPETSIGLIKPLKVDKQQPVIDIGSGDSALVDWLLNEGYTQVHALDISAAALERLRDRLPLDQVGHLYLHATPVVDFQPPVQYALWHDRAVFHFLTDPADIVAYVQLAIDAITVGGYLVLGTFAPDGPEKCSGLYVSRYSPEDLATLFAPHFREVNRLSVVHPTPFGTTQSFSFVVLQRQ